MLSKSNPVMKNKPPVSWTTNQEGIDAMIRFNKNADNAARFIVKRKYGHLTKTGPHTELNAIKKWLDRIIRGMIP